MKLCRGDVANAAASTVFGNGDGDGERGDLVPKSTVTAASPWPATVTLPSSSTSATSSSLDPNLAHRVTSSACRRSTRPGRPRCSVSFGFSSAAGGNTSMRSSCGVGVRRARGAGGDPVGERACSRRESTSNRVPPPCGSGQRRLRAAAGCRPGFVRSTRRPSGLPGQDEVVGVGVVAAERELQPALAGERPVARPGVAAGPRQHRDDVVAEAPVAGFVAAHA